MDCVNVIMFGDISVNVIDPFSVTISTLAASDTSLVSVTRFLRISGQNVGSGVDIVTKASIAGQIVTVANIWLDSETPVAGFYRIKIVAKNNDNSAEDEANVFINVLP